VSHLGLLLPLLAHGEAAGDHGHAGELALTGIAISAMVIPLVLLAVVGVGFYRSAKRDAESRERTSPGDG
jgi:hypothetical protein